MKKENPEWIALPEIKRLPKWKIAMDKENELLQIVLNLVQDGICILDADLNILYANSAMETWYGCREQEGKKCYIIYHERNEPCKDCPVQKAILCKNPQTEIHLLENVNGKGWHRSFCVPILDGKGDVAMVIEYIQDITKVCLSEAALELLSKQTQLLETMANEQKEEYQRHEQMTLQNIYNAIDNVKNYLREMFRDEVAGIVEQQLLLALSDTFPDRQPPLPVLSEKEKQVAKYIKAGYISKEIADKLNLSKKTVDYYRNQLRKKFGLDSKSSLKSYLNDNTHYFL